MRNILCALGFHVPLRGAFIVNHGWYNKKITSRSACCKHCGKKLFLVDKYGERKE